MLSGSVLCCLGVDRKMFKAVWDAFMGLRVFQVLVQVLGMLSESSALAG